MPAMDSTGVDVPEAKRGRTTPPAGCGAEDAAGGVDLISGLGDDLLLRILELLPEARDVVRTSALSWRWHSLCMRVPVLRFASGSWPEFASGAGGAERFASFVSESLAQRAAQTKPAVQHLAISYTLKELSGREVQQVAPLSIGAAQRWIRYTAKHTVRSFILELRLYQKGYSHRASDRSGNRRKKKSVINLTKLPSSAKLETMHLALAGARLRLPATAVFTSLTDLSLEHIKVLAGGGHLLDRFLSPACCPCLQKLRLSKLRLGGPKELLLETNSLWEVSLEFMEALEFLELSTPSLRVLHMEACDELGVLRVSAPRLEELAFLDQPWPQVIDEDDLVRVGSLKLDMCSHEDGDHPTDTINDVSIDLLERCRSATCLDVSLQVPEGSDQVVDIIEGKIPQLTHVTYLIVHVSLWERHSIGVGVASLLTQCINLKYLNLCSDYKFKKKQPYNPEPDTDADFLCNHSDPWQPREISLAHLQEVEFNGLTGIDCELRFMQFVLNSTTQPDKVTISFNPSYWIKSKADAFQLMLQGNGTWTTCRDAFSYEWKPCLDKWSV